MAATAVTLGRTFVVTFDHGDGFFPALHAVCRDNGIRQGYVPMFIAGFADVRVVGACDRLEDPNAPVWSGAHFTNVEVLGAGTLAYEPETDTVSPHLHVTVGRRPAPRTATPGTCWKRP
ncbi:DUF296 domain-containing protein [Glycomyces sp. A-F 0318]|nr:DUF296 domain-containing protein [Glycomyces amatae]MCD0446263.1 DUF296 domain-containing protein [Glycomyces amatae]